MKLADGPAELAARVQVGQHFIDAGLHDADRPAGEHRAFVIQTGHKNLDAFALLAQHVLDGNRAVLEHQFAGVGAAHAELVQLRRARESGVIALDDKGADAARGRGRVGFGVDHIHVGVGAVGDPHLVAVQDIAIAVALRVQRHAHHVRARVRLGHGQGADLFTATQGGQIALFLRLAAVPIDLVETQIGHGAVGQPHRGRRAADFLHHHGVGQVAQAAAPVGFVHGDAEQAHRAELGPQIGGEFIVAVDGGGARCDLLLTHPQHGVAESVDVFAEAEVERGIGAVHRRVSVLTGVLRAWGLCACAARRRRAVMRPAR